MLILILILFSLRLETVTTRLLRLLAHTTASRVPSFESIPIPVSQNTRLWLARPPSSIIMHLDRACPCLCR